MKSVTELTSIEKTVFYALDKTIKSYRQFAQRNLKANNIDITIDQWLVLKTIHDHPDLTQREIADHVFKDYASITRMIELLVKRNYLKRSFHSGDRRRFTIELTDGGNKIYQKLIPIIHRNRSIALAGLELADISAMHHLLEPCSRN